MDRGLELFGQQQYQQAIAMFNLALELPGNAAYRLPGSPREYRSVSAGASLAIIAAHSNATVLGCRSLASVRTQLPERRRGERSAV